VKITNKTGLPEPIVDAIRNDTYSSGDADISITALLQPPRKIALERQYADQLEEDASDRIWSLLGQVIHGILERSGSSGTREKRYSMKVSDWTVSGQIDRYFEGTLQDYKFVTVYKVKEGVDPDYEAQLNGYAELLRQQGAPVKKLELVAILRDWSKLAARREPETYPQSQVLVQDVPLWPPGKVEAFLNGRVLLHRQARTYLPDCTPAERWAKPTQFAVMKKGQPRAVRLYSQDEESLALARAASAPDLSVQVRRGENTRCENYCSVAPFCSQFQQLKQAQGEIQNESA
jgi:hypothetical protein